MSLLQGLHGTIAIVLLCGLLFVEEAGVPLPFAPGELTLLAAGLLVASGGLNPFIFVPLAIVACIAGAVLGYSWARLVGEHGLRTVAVKLHQEKNLERVSRRVRAGGARGIALSRSILGLRIYTTLLAGAAGFPLRTFLIGMAPASAVWVVAFVVLGAVIGLPVEHFLTNLQKLLVQGVILIAIGVGGYVAVRRAPADQPGVLLRVPYAMRVALAVAIDAGIVASVAAGVMTMGRVIAHVDLTTNWLDIVVVIGMIVVFYVVATRRGTGATVGETLLSADYIRRLRSAGPRMREHLRPTTPASPEALQPAASIFKALGETTRLKIVQCLMDDDLTQAEVTERAGVGEQEAAYLLASLERAGVIGVAAGAEPRRYRMDAGVAAAVRHVLQAEQHNRARVLQPMLTPDA